MLTDALAKYLALKGKGKNKAFVRGANRNINYVITSPFFVKKWGLELIKACGFDNLLSSRSFSGIPRIDMIGMCKRNILEYNQNCKKVQLRFRNLSF